MHSLRALILTAFLSFRLSHILMLPDLIHCQNNNTSDCQHLFLSLLLPSYRQTAQSHDTRIAASQDQEKSLQQLKRFRSLHQES